MGEYAEMDLERMIDELPFRHHAPRSKWTATCSRCGMAGLKWRPEAEGWRLFEDERVEHNRLKPHVCGEQGDPADDFEDLTGGSDV